MVKTKKKWGFLAPTREEAERMEKKYGVHFTPLIDYMKVIFPDIDDWEEEKIVDTGLEVDDKEEFIQPHLSSDIGRIVINIGKSVEIYDEYGIATGFGTDINYYDCCNGGNYKVYCIDEYAQLTNATVKQIFGVDVAEPLFDETKDTISQKWINITPSRKSAEDFLKGRYVGDEKQYQINFDAYNKQMSVYWNFGISKIIVEKLFGLYNYEIDLNTDKNISILIGPNGCGKTTILKIVRFLLSGIGDIHEIIKVPFESMECELINGRKIKLEHYNIDDDLALRVLIDNNVVAVFCENIRNDNFQKLLNDKRKDFYFLKWRPELEKYENIKIPFITANNLRKLHHLDNTVDINDDYILKRMFQESLRSFKCYFNTEFISAQRLFHQIDDKKDNNESDDENIHKYSDNISEIKKHFKHLCETTREKYNEAKAHAEHWLFDDYVMHGLDGHIVLEGAVFEKEWKEFSEERWIYEHNKALNSLYDYGRDYNYECDGEVIETDEMVMKQYTRNNRGMKEFLCIYLKNFERALKRLKEPHEKTMLFQDIINDRLKITQKQLQYRFGEMYLTIGEGKGKKEIPLEVLSSGEQNDFIMFYNLIFNCENSKVFIDEPEISLHIEWQERYIDDLIKICEMNNIQALVATHSPNIINDHTDLIAKWEIKDEL